MQSDAHHQTLWVAPGSWRRREALAQPEGGQNGALGMILLGQRGTKHRQEAISRYLLHRPAVLQDLTLGEGIEGAHLVMQRLKIPRCLSVRGRCQSAAK